MTFPINYAASVTMGLTFLKTWKAVDPEWNAKDLVVLFFDDYDQQTGLTGANYAQSVQEFLSRYYAGHSSAKDADVAQLLRSDTRIHGRCGYLRQGLPYVFTEF